MYSLYLLEANVEQKDFLKDAQEGYGKSRYSAQIQDTWRPPLVFSSKSRNTWFVVVGEPYQQGLGSIKIWILSLGFSNQLNRA